MATYSQIKELKNRYRDSLFSKSKVVGVGVGRKIVEGEVTKELSIKIYVEKKIAPSRLTDRDGIPKTLDGVKTDVVEIGKIRFQGPRDRNRPTKGGDSAGSCHSTAFGYIMAGTMGVALIDKSDGKRVLLSNNHVFADMDNDGETRAHAGDTIVQPGTLDGGSCTTDAIGTLKRWIPFRMHADNDVDGAIADINNESDAQECQIGCDIGRVKGYRVLDERDLDSQVQKCGRTTGYTTGTVMDVDATVDVSYEVLTSSGVVVRTVRFANQILTTGMSDSGDSGSLVLDMDEKAVGLLFAGSGTTTVANRIENVLTALNLEFCPTIDLCRPGGPQNRVVICPRSGPNSFALCSRSGPIVTPLCRRGQPGMVVCVRGGPNTAVSCAAGPQEIVRCLACGPTSPIGCGSGGPDNLIDVATCSAGPQLDIQIKDPSIDPSRVVVIDIEKVPRDMRSAFEKMLRAMSEER